MNIGECHLLANRAEEAQHRLAAALEIFIEVENRALEGECRVILGGLLVRMGDPAQARTMLEAGLEICRDFGRAEIVGTGLCELAAVDLADGNIDAAILAFREAADHYADMKSVKQWRAELPLARLLHDRGETDEARTRAEAAATQIREQLRVLPDDASRAELEAELAGAQAML